MAEKEKKSSYTGYTAARKQANEKYLKESVEEIKLRVPKGSKDNIKAAAAAAGETLNGYIVNAIKGRMAADSAGTME